MKRLHLSGGAALMIAAVSAAFSAVLMMRLPLSGLTPVSALSIAGLAVFSTLLGHTMCNYALKTISATTVSTVMLTEVITGPLMVFFVMGEIPSRATFLGGAVILIAVVLYLRIESSALRRL